MFWKSETMQQRWDEEIRGCRESWITANTEADGFDRWARIADSWPIIRRFAYSLRNKAADRRDWAGENLDIADCMETCRNNPRNGGPGFHTPQRLRLADLGFLIVWLVVVILPAFMTTGAWIALALSRHPQYADSPMLLLVAFGALLVGMLTITIMSAVMRTIQAAGYITADTCRFIVAHIADAAAWVHYVRTP